MFNDKHAIQVQLPIYRDTFIPLKMKVTNIILIITVILLTGCTLAPHNDTDSTTKATNLSSDTLSTLQQEDTAYNEYMAHRLKPIRENVNRINSIAKWTSTDKIELEESTEGGEATFYYSGGVLEKIVTRHFGETFQLLTEYYLLNGQLSFILEKASNYNRPIYWDSASMKETDDDQVFDLARSEITEDRSYFENGKLIHQVNNQGSGYSFQAEILSEEQKRITEDFERLKKLKK